MEKSKQFYKKGIRFACQGSGKCCVTRGKYAYVYLSFHDRKRLAAYLGIAPRTFTIGYTQKTDGLYHLKDPEKSCPFFEDNRCAVYEARPRQCRTWPFWPENMAQEVWEREVASYCPGVGTGRLYSAEEIETILEKSRTVS